MYVIIVSGVVVRLSHVEPKVGLESSFISFLFPSVFLFFFFFVFVLFWLFIFVVVVFEIYTFQSKDSIYLRINNLNFYRFPQFTFLFYCNILYKPKTVVTCSHRLPFIYLFKCDLNLNAGFFFPPNLFPVDYEQSLFEQNARHANGHARDWWRETGEARKKRAVSLFSSRAAPSFRASRGFAAPARVHSSEEKDRRGGGKRRGLGPRGDVLTTCKAVTPRGDQRIIAVLFPQ